MNLDLSSYDPDLDDALRRELGTTDLPSLDPAALATAGGRALRRRRIAAASGVTAAVLTLAIGGYAARDAFSRNALPNPPAGSSSTRSAAGPVTATLESMNASFETTGGATKIPGATHFAVTWSPSAGADGRNLTFAAVADSGARTPIGGFSTLGVSPDAVSWGTGPGTQAIVGVLPAAATQFRVVLPYAANGGHGSTSAQGALAGTPWQAFAIAFQEAADVGRIVDLLWLGPDAVVHDRTGTVVPSVTLSDRKHRTFYVADADDTFGVFSTSGGGASGWLSAARSGHPVLSMGQAKDSTAPMDGFFAMLVPSGSTAPALTPSASTSGSTQPQIVDIPGSRWAVLWSDYTSDGVVLAGAFARVEWTGPDGQRTVVTKF